MAVTDLVLLDIKHIRPDAHKKLTGFTNETILDFARYLSDKEKPVWIRHVLVPEWTDEDEALKALSGFIKTLTNALPNPSGRRSAFPAARRASRRPQRNASSMPSAFSDADPQTHSSSTDFPSFP